MINNHIRALPLTEQKASSWKNKVAGSINANNVIAGSGIRIDYGPNGAEISLDVVNETAPLRYMGDFDINAEYYPNMMVRVRSDQTYLDITGNPLPFGSFNPASEAIPPIATGLFICVNYVPPGPCDENWLTTVVAPMYPQGVPFNLVQGTRFYAANIYYPVYPEMPLSYTSSYAVLSGNSTIIENNTFWNFLGGGGGAGNGFPVWL